MSQGGIVLILAEHHQRTENVGFSEFRVGLDYLSFAVESTAILEDWVKRLDYFQMQHNEISQGGGSAGISRSR